MTLSTHLSTKTGTFLMVLLSIIPFAQRAVESFDTGVFLSAYVFGCSVLLLALAFVFGKGIVSKVILRGWGLLLIIYAVARILLVAAAQLGGIESAHVRDSAGAVYLIASLVLMFIGVRLLSYQLWSSIDFGGRQTSRMR